MKSTVCAIALVFMSSAPALARTVVAKCSNEDGTTKLTLSQESQDVYAAAVTVESFGGATPTSHFKNIITKPEAAGMMGGAQVFVGKGFELSVVFTAFDKPAILTIPALGINREQLTCK